MGINNYYQWEYNGKYDHFDILLVESEIVLWDENTVKVKKLKGGFATGEFILGYVNMQILMHKWSVCERVCAC